MLRQVKTPNLKNQAGILEGGASVPRGCLRDKGNPFGLWQGRDCQKTTQGRRMLKKGVMQEPCAGQEGITPRPPTWWRTKEAIGRSPGSAEPDKPRGLRTEFMREWRCNSSGLLPQICCQMTSCHTKHRTEDR